MESRVIYDIRTYRVKVVRPPPGAADTPHTMANKLMMPSAFSPVQQGC